MEHSRDDPDRLAAELNDALNRTGQRAAEEPRPARDHALLDTWLDRVRQENGSDLLLVAGAPPMIRAKLCIDTAGKVTVVNVLTRLDREASSDLAGALRAWSYAPYRRAGTPVAACFVVTLRVK